MFRKYSKVLANKARISNLLLSFLFLLLASVSKSFTGSFHQFANRYLGDLFIVGWLYYLVLLFIPKLRPLIAAAVVFVISVLVEIAQAHLDSILPGASIQMLYWTGTTFDPLDIFFYLAGVALAAIADLVLIRGKECSFPAT